MSHGLPVRPLLDLDRMRAIQRHLPNPRMVEINRIWVKAPPDAAWQAARHFDGASIPWIRWLFGLREIPRRLIGRPPAVTDRRLGVDQVADSGKGFLILEEEPGREVVVGSVGRFWHSDIPYADVTSRTFASFSTPGWGKLAWSIRVEPAPTGSIVTFELRTTATDENSWTYLDRYFHLIGPASRLIRASVMSQLEAQLRRAALPSDDDRALPGDAVLADARYSLTHALDIEAPPSLVWPWLMQLGCDRAGWYSIDALDHGGVPSVDHLVPAWGERRIGDDVATTPANDSFYRVLAVEKDELFVIGGTAERLGGRIEMAWSFVLEPIGADATHLVTRVRARGAPRWSEWFQGAVLFPPVHSLMQHVQLSTLKRLAEREALARL